MQQAEHLHDEYRKTVASDSWTANGIEWQPVYFTSAWSVPANILTQKKYSETSSALVNVTFLFQSMRRDN